MNRLVIFTRSYINDSGVWDLSENCINSVHKLMDLVEYDAFQWIVLVSNVKSNEEFRLVSDTISPRDSKDSGKKLINQHFIALREKCSCSEAREVIYKHILLEESTNLMFDKDTYYMNLDADDWLVNIDKIAAFINGPKIDSDLIGFGLEVPEDFNLSHEWNWSEEKFRKSRRYSTTETQTMFLFLHRIEIIKLAIGGLFFKTGKSGEPNESCDDTLMAIEVAHENKLRSEIPCDEPVFRISAICYNFIHYHIHPGQVSENQQSEYKKSLNDLLKELGYLYINHKFYRERNGEIVEYNPYDEEILVQIYKGGSVIKSFRTNRRVRSALKLLNFVNNYGSHFECAHNLGEGEFRIEFAPDFAINVYINDECEINPDKIKDYFDCLLNLKR